MAHSGNGTEKIVLAYGELLWDLLPSGRVLGGAPANFAYRLKQLGTKVELISRVGADDLGQEALSQLRAKGLETNFIQVDRLNPTGTVTVELSEKGDAQYEIHTGVAYDFVELTPENTALAQAASAVCFGTLVQRAPQTRETLYSLLNAGKKAFKLVDINLRKNCFSAETLDGSLTHADLLKLNHEEAKTVGKLLSLPHDTLENFAKAVMQRYRPSIVLVTHGKEGVSCFDREGANVHIEGYSVKVADTVGSGDNFTAGFLHKFLLGEDLQSCCRFANRVGALCASKQGGMPEIAPSEITAMPEARAD